MKVNFETHSYTNKKFEGEEVAPHFGKEYFGLTAGDFVTLDREDAGGAVKFKFYMTAKYFWDWYSANGLDMAELNIPPSLDLRGETVAGITLKDVIQGGVLMVKTPSKTHQFYIGEKARGVNNESSLLSFTESGEYQISFLFSTWYRYSANVLIGKMENQYHVFTHKFEIAAEGEPNAVDEIELAVDEVLRFDHRSEKAEIQKRSDDFYYWKNCKIESMVHNFTNGAGQKFYNITYLYGENRKTETWREEFAPNYEVSGAK